MQDAEEECGCWGGEGRGEIVRRDEQGPLCRCRTRSVSRIQTQISLLLPNPAFLFCILHRVKIPHPTFFSPLISPPPTLKRSSERRSTPLPSGTPPPTGNPASAAASCRTPQTARRPRSKSLPEESSAARARAPCIRCDP